jgi:hypothetical protein
MTRRHRLACVSILLAGVLAPPTAVADSVYLKNGQSFEGVEAVVSGDTVKIDLAIGSMRLPMSQVERIEEVDSTLGEYRVREARLRSEGGDAAAWLELARWARERDFDQGAAKAAARAARLDPGLPELEPLMTSLGWVRDENASEWLPYDEAMRRQGLVEDRGEWVTPEERRERSQSRVETVAEESRSRTDDHLDKALDILAEAVKKPETPSNTTVIVQQPGFGFGTFPGFGLLPGGFVGAPFLAGGEVESRVPFSLSGTFFTGDARPTRVTGWNEMTLRQPGSFIPATSRFFR